jgi:hypothetical protein
LVILGHCYFWNFMPFSFLESLSYFFLENCFLRNYLNNFLNSYKSKIEGYLALYWVGTLTKYRGLGSNSLLLRTWKSSLARDPSTPRKKVALNTARIGNWE